MTTWPLCEIPEPPPARGFESSATATLRPRYEDISQDGRVQLATVMPGLGAVWRKLYNAETMDTFKREGILPILRRLVIRGEDGPFSVHVPLECDGTWRLARESNGDRLFLDMWLEARAPIASTLGDAPPPDAPKVRVARIYAEHVITKPFAPPAERKVTRLDAPGLPAIPEDEHAFEDAGDLIASSALEPAGDHVFGMMHTDSNQHVNSLVYPRLFEEAVVRRLVSSSPSSSTHLARALEMRWRKPFFAGDHAALTMALGDPTPAGVPAVGAFAPAGGGHAKPSSTIAMWLR